METINQIKLEPSFDGSFGNGWKVMNKHFLTLLLVVFILGIIVTPAMVLNIHLDGKDFNWHDWHSIYNITFFQPGIVALTILTLLIGLFALAYKLLLTPVFVFGANLMFVHAVRDTRPQFETLVSGFKENYFYIVLANLLTTALVMMGMLILIIPGIIIGCRLAFVSYLVMDKKLDPIVAVEESWKLTKGHGWTIFFMGFVSFFIIVIGLCMCFVGIYPALVWVKGSWASMYEAVLTEKNALNGNNVVNNNTSDTH